jgi:choline kinase
MNTFRVALEEAVRGPEAMQSWYLSVLNTMCLSSVVETVSIEGLWWGEIDTPEDLAKVRSHFLSRTIIRPRVVQRSL